MKKIIYTEHLEFRIKRREIPYNLPKTIYKNAKERFLDIETGHKIAIAKGKIRGKIKEFLVAYDEYEDEIMLITIHPIKPYQKLSRIRNGRWQKL